jgi:hypothetical protein
VKARTYLILLGKYLYHGILVTNLAVINELNLLLFRIKFFIVCIRSEAEKFIYIWRSNMFLDRLRIYRSTTSFYICLIFKNFVALGKIFQMNSSSKFLFLFRQTSILWHWNFKIIFFCYRSDERVGLNQVPREPLVLWHEWRWPVPTVQPLSTSPYSV